MTIIKPIITEKSMKDAQSSKFTFAVHRFADKDTVKKAIEKAYGVSVEGVFTSVFKGNRVRVGKRRTEVKKSPWKKALVALKKGQKIDLFDVEQK